MIRLALAAVLLATPAAAQQCGSYAALAEHLADRWSESRVAVGVQGEGQRAVELWSAQEGATFTLVIRDLASGIGCIISAGKGWTATGAQPPKGKRS